MSISKVIRKRLVFFIVTLVFIVLLTITSTYAFQKEKIVNNNGVFNNGNLSIKYVMGNNSLKTCSYPLSFQQGIQKSPENLIKIVNKGTFSTKYSVMVSYDMDNNELIDANKVYLSVNNNVVGLLSSLQKNILLTDELKPNEEKVLDIRAWVALEYIENTDQGKELDLKIKVLNK